MKDSSKTPPTNYAIEAHLKSLERANSGKADESFIQSDAVTNAIITLANLGKNPKHAELMAHYRDRLDAALKGALKLNSRAFEPGRLTKFAVALARQRLANIKEVKPKEPQTTDADNSVETDQKSQSTQFKKVMETVSYIISSATNVPMCGQVAQFSNAIKGINLSGLTPDEKTKIANMIQGAITAEMQATDVQGAGVLQKVLQPLLSYLHINTAPRDTVLELK